MVTALMVAFALVQNTDDRDVLQTAMLSFFKPERWYSLDWKPKHRIFIYPEFDSRKPTYESLLYEAIYNTEGDLKALHKSPRTKGSTARKKAVREVLNEFRAALRSAKASPTYSPSPMQSISPSSWDKRIMVTESTGRGYQSLSKEPKDPRLEELGVYVYATRPTYSPDGSRCMLRFRIPWSGYHSAEVIFLLQRPPTRPWEIKASTAMFYV